MTESETGEGAAKRYISAEVEAWLSTFIDRLIQERDAARVALTASEQQAHEWHAMAATYAQLEPELAEVRAERDAARAQLAAQQAENERLREEQEQRVHDDARLLARRATIAMERDEFKACFETARYRITKLEEALQDVIAESEQGEFIRAWDVAKHALLSGGEEPAS